MQSAAAIPVMAMTEEEREAVSGDDQVRAHTYGLLGALLSGAPGTAEYRLSIKREDRGLASRALHDMVEVGHVIEARPPSGDFVVGCSQCPLVLASAGVGLTPMVSMLHKAAADAGDRPVWYAHGALRVTCLDCAAIRMAVFTILYSKWCFYHARVSREKI